MVGSLPGEPTTSSQRQWGIEELLLVGVWGLVGMVDIHIMKPAKPLAVLGVDPLKSTLVQRCRAFVLAFVAGRGGKQRIGTVVH
jgi:hypothetical protein